MNQYYWFDKVPNGVSLSYEPIDEFENSTFRFKNNAFLRIYFFSSKTVHIHAQVKLFSPYGLALLENLAVRQRGDTGGFGMRS